MRCTAAIVCLLGIPAMAPAGADEPTAPPRPPRQDAPWTPPETKLPRFLVASATALYEQGLADPRGCEYREIRPASERDLDPDPKAGRPALHGWVLPAAPGGRARFAVGWDGLVHPLADVGPEADLEADVRAMTKPPEPVDGQPAPHRAGFQYGQAWGDRMHAAQAGLRPMKVILLLRLGRADLAERVWSAGTGWSAGRSRVDLAGYGVSYLSLTSDWAWCLFDRALSAHARGDDPLALASLRELARIRPLIEARAEAMGFPRRQVEDGIRIAGRPNEVRILSYLDFLSRLPALLADQERRAREPRREGDPTKVADRAARIAALIREFDRIGVESHSSFGRANPGGAAVAQAVVKEGSAAVGPLLDCLERDDRLTRTVHRDDRHGTRYASVSGVDEAAFSALVRILGTREFGPQSRHFPSIGSGDREKRRAAAAEVRAYWEKNRGAGPEERWYRTLADDSATPDQWLDAAEALSQATNVHGRGGSYATYSVPAGTVAPLRGEPLRGEKSPSISELMARRVEAIDPSGGVVAPGLSNPASGTGHVFAVLKADGMARFLARWDPAASLPTLRARVGRCRALIAASRGRGQPEQQALKSHLAEFTLDRLRGGDPKALEDYAEAARIVSFSPTDTFPADFFEPMWRNPDHPAIAAAAIALFDDPKSPWVDAFLDRGRHPQWAWGRTSLTGLMTTPLLGVAPFRKLVLACLDDRGEAGSIVTDAQGKIEVATKAGATMPRPPMDDPLRPKPSTRMPLRRADLWGQALQNVGGMPRIEMYWPEAERDRAITACVARLRQYGERFRFDEATRPRSNHDPFDRGRLTASLSFPPLDRPATAEDVWAGRAIFAIEGAAEVRRWPLPSRPMTARWTTLEIAPDDPGLAGSRVTAGKPTAQTRMLQTGAVWQAEDAREGDRWRCHYGFVGRHVLARVPAEEVEFPAPWSGGWSENSGALDARIIPPGGRDDGLRVLQGDLAMGAPLPVEVQLRNRLGIESSVRADWLRAGFPPTLREGMTVRLSRAPDAPPEPARNADVSPPWDEVAARPLPRHRGDEAKRTLAPAEVITALKLDLRELFVVDRPGRYRLDVTFEDRKTVEGKPGMASAYFTISGSTKAE